MVLRYPNARQYEQLVRDSSSAISLKTVQPCSSIRLRFEAFCSERFFSISAEPILRYVATFLMIRQKVPGPPTLLSRRLHCYRPH
jgi:hypothetical protein